jgi:hypothetical protein
VLIDFYLKLDEFEASVLFLFAFFIFAWGKNGWL